MGPTARSYAGSPSRAPTVRVAHHRRLVGPVQLDADDAASRVAVRFEGRAAVGAVTALDREMPAMAHHRTPHAGRSSEMVWAAR